VLNLNQSSLSPGCQDIYYSSQRVLGHDLNLSVLCDVISHVSIPLTVYDLLWVVSLNKPSLAHY